MINLSPTPACRNVCLHEAFRPRQALRRAGTNHENATYFPSPVKGEGQGGGGQVGFTPPTFHPPPQGGRRFLVLFSI